MKIKVIVLCIIIALATATTGNCRHSDDIAPAIIGATIGAIVISTIVDQDDRRDDYYDRRDDRRDYRDDRRDDRRYRHDDRYYRGPCYETIYGEWRRDDYGRRYWHEFRHPRQIKVPCRDRRRRY